MKSLFKREKSETPIPTIAISLFNPCPGSGTQCSHTPFKVCGLNIATDGSEDEQIHSFKNHSCFSNFTALLKQPMCRHWAKINFKSFHFMKGDYDGKSDIDIFDMFHTIISLFEIQNIFHIICYAYLGKENTVCSFIFQSEMKAAN